MGMSDVTLCGASYYEQKYYFNPEFDKLPTVIKEELQIMVVSFTEKVGGVLTLVFAEEDNLQFQVQALDGDGRFDEIGSALEIKKLQVEKKNFWSHWNCFIKHVSRCRKINGKTNRRGAYL